MDIKRHTIRAATVLATGGLLASAAAADVVIRYAEYGPDRGVRAEAIRFFAEQIEERSGGEIRLDMSWGGALVSGRDVLRAVSTGFVDAGSFVPSWEPQALHLYEVGDLPAGTPDAWVGMRAAFELATENQAVIDEFASQNVALMMQFNSGPVQLMCRQPITSVEDFEGLRIRTVGPFIQAFRALGAEITSFPSVEVYQAIDSGLLECSQNYWSNITAYRLHEVAEHMVELNFGQVLGFGALINLDVWESLTDDQQALMREVGRDTTDHLARLLLNLEDDIRGQLEAGIDGHSVTIATPPEAVMDALWGQSDVLTQAWLDATEARGLDGSGVLEHFLAAEARYEEALANDGYPWD